MKPKRNLTKINKQKTFDTLIHSKRVKTNKNWTKLTFKKQTAIKRTNQIYTLHWVVFIIIRSIYYIVISY